MRIAVIGTGNIGGTLGSRWREAGHDVVYGSPGASYARAFNTLGWENFADPLPGTDLFFASDPDARATVEELISTIGLGPVYVGGADAVRAVDSLLGLWFALTQQTGTRKIAFRLVK
jgi:8-hydroxy-5-deazaflavin:NADPH oxidoreductase